MSVAAQAAGHDDDIGPIEVGEGLLDQLGPTGPGDRTAATADRDQRELPGIRPSTPRKASDSSARTP